MPFMKSVSQNILWTIKKSRKKSTEIVSFANEIEYNILIFDELHICIRI